MQVDIDKAIEIEEKLFGDCFENSEQKEGMKNFLEKGKKNKKSDEKKKNLQEAHKDQKQQ